jgi:hypothetical protein
VVVVKDNDMDPLFTFDDLLSDLRYPVTVTERKWIDYLERDFNLKNIEKVAERKIKMIEINRQSRIEQENRLNKGDSGLMVKMDKFFSKREQKASTKEDEKKE